VLKGVVAASSGLKTAMFLVNQMFIGPCIIVITEE